MKIKHFLQLIVFICLAALIIADCAYLPEENPAPAETVPVTEETEPTETVPPETEPPAEAGWAVTVDGDVLESGSILLDGTAWVKAEEFLTALDRGGLYADENGYTLYWEGTLYQFHGEKDNCRIYRGELWLALDEMCDALNLSVYEDAEFSRVYCTSGILNMEIPTDIRVPVLMYHAVDGEFWGHKELFVSPETMESHLKFLVENGYDPIFFEDLYQADKYDKPVIITFDDGYLNNYTELFPLLQKYNVKATVFVVTSSIGGKDTSMTEAQVKELSDSGLVSIQSHTVNHLVLEGLSPEEQRLEMEQSKLLVTRMTGREPFVISYPTGAYDENTLTLAAEFYQYAVIVRNRDYVTGSDPYTICRYNIRDTTTMAELAWMVADAGQPG